MRERKVFEPGIYVISNDEYHASAGISRTGIMEFRRTPKHFWNRYLNPNYQPKEKTVSLEFGGAVHPFILEPEKFEEEYCIIPKFDKRTKIGKAAHEEAVELNKGKIILNEEDYYSIKQIRDNLFNDKQAKALISNANYEHSIYWIDPDTNLLCKCRPDIWHDNFIVDLKTTKNASYREFQSDFYHYGYHLQLGMMHEAFKHTVKKEMNNFIDLAVEKIEPYCHAIFTIDESAVQHGVEEFHYYLKQIMQCYEKNEWPGYGIKQLSLPPYAKIGE